MGVRVNSRRHPDEYVLHLARFSRYAVQQVQFVEAVHHYPPDALVDGVGQFVGCLVVAVEIDLFQRELGGDGHRQFPAGYHVQAQALLVENLGQGRVDVGLGGVEHLGSGAALFELGAVAAAPVAQGGLVQHVDGGAVLLGQVQGRAAANNQPPLPVNFGSIGKNVLREHGDYLEFGMRWLGV